LERLVSTETQCLQRLDNVRAHNFDNLHFNARNVGARALEEPLVTSVALKIALLKVANGTKTKSSVRRNNLKGRHLPKELLARVKRERVLFTTDLLISMTDTILLQLVAQGRAILPTLHRVLDDSIMAWGNHNHGLWTSYELLMFLASKSLRTILNTSNVGVVVQNMDIMKGLDSDNRVSHA